MPTTAFSLFAVKKTSSSLKKRTTRKSTSSSLLLMSKQLAMLNKELLALLNPKLPTNDWACDQLINNTEKISSSVSHHIYGCRACRNLYQHECQRSHSTFADPRSLVKLGHYSIVNRTTMLTSVSPQTTPIRPSSISSCILRLNVLIKAWSNTLRLLYAKAKEFDQT